MLRTLFTSWFAMLLGFSMLTTGLAQEQAAQAQASRATSTAKPAQLQVAVPDSSTFSKEVQSALESGDKRTAKKLCGAQCKPNAPGRISAAPTGGSRDYNCENGNCACVSIPDCVAMTDICAPGTTGCNDYGCTCGEKEPEPAPDP